MQRGRREDRLHLAFSAGLAVVAGGAFWVPALGATGGDWPAPLDDVFIHYDFARATAAGHPFEWIAGQGFSSGETSPLYPLVLAVGYAAGFRGLWLGAWAALVALASLVVLMRAARELVQPAPAWVGFIASALVVCVGALDWAWFSGMEVALFGGVLGRALVAAKRAREAPPWTRDAAQWTCGAWGAALVLVRPEAAVLVATFAVIVARRAGARSASLALARVGLPGALATLGVLGLNRALTGDAMSAGAILKLLSRNPYLSDVDRARELALNLASFHLRVLEAGLAPWPRLWLVVPLLALAGLAAARTRGLAAACLTSAVLWTLLVSWNGAARYQNFRYYAPALALLVVGAALGVAAAARPRRTRTLYAATGAIAVLLAAPQVRAQAEHFRRASKNVHDQQVEVGRRLAKGAPDDAIVLVGDAGAIPYVSRRAAIDALGLGGFHRIPFARAATHGEAATVELLQRMPPAERPTLLALYPNWFAAITSRFGREVDRVTIEDNVICGGPTKGIYVADWTALDASDEPPPGVVDELDVADVLSEEAHAYASPAPSGGWTVLDVRAGVFDAGRILPEGRAERFTTLRAAEPATLWVRVADAGAALTIDVSRGGVVRARADATPSASKPGAWPLVRAALPGGVQAGDTLTLRASRGEVRDFHVWLSGGGPADDGPRSRGE
jgi:hypothetical protein